jgi:RND family efflux transporter MFP subunit
MSVFYRSGALALAALLLAACSESEANKAEDPQVQTVVIEPVSDSAVIGTRNFVGRLAPVSTVNVSFRVGGELIEIPVGEGTKVEKGALLAALDPTDYELALRQAKLSAELAKADFERKEKLLTSNSISRAAFDQSKTDHELREVAAENALRDLSYTAIEAPFDALITRRLTDAHTNVQAGQQVLRIQDISEFRVKISVPEDILRLVGDPKMIQAEAMIPGTDKRYPLEYREHNTEADSVAQTYEVTFGMAPPTDANLLPGMTVAVAVASTARPLCWMLRLGVVVVTKSARFSATPMIKTFVSYRSAIVMDGTSNVSPHAGAVRAIATHANAAGHRARRFQARQ